MAFYLDTSALAKLVVAEPETAALRAWLAEQDRTLVSSDLARTELTRAVRRVAPERMIDAHAVLDGLTLLTVPASMFAAAGRLDPVDLRSLDAVHLAAALELGDDLEGLVAYDERLQRAARLNGIDVIAPA
ncbi:MAG: type II toxin-antitoxin system VapC family toxin [Actinomycetota bacterium]|nr:type II toxin-antitoxin system VapC family toxin [Actinomycetota bacterium]